MIFISNFYKLITIIILIILIFTIFTNFNKEKFDGDVVEQLYKEKPINFRVEKIPKHEQSTKDKGKNQFKIRWWHDNTKNINKYVLASFINNKGPYLDTFTISQELAASDDAVTKYYYTYNNITKQLIGKNNDEINYIHDNIKGNVKYKYSIYAIVEASDVPTTIANTSNIGCVATNTDTPNKNIKEVTLSNVDDSIDVVKSGSFRSSIICNPDGSHKIISDNRCSIAKENLEDRAIIATNSLDKSNDEHNYFNEENYKDLMDDLMNEKSLEYKLEFNIN